MRVIQLLVVAALFTLAAASVSQAQEAAKRMKGGKPSASNETAADEARSFAAYKAVEKALEPYIDAAKSGDGALSRSAFFDHAHIVGSVKGEYFAATADQFEGAVTEGGPSPKVRHRIAWIDISGPAAAAKVEFIDWGGMRYTDFFVLYQRDGEWKISSKVYDSHSNN